jgi:ubiquinone/menaquinone biosynthesis C-methylase UbiE
MKPAIDPQINYKQLVRAGYDRCAHAYREARAGGPTTGLALLFDHLSPPASVLDLGCGSGVPVARVLSERYEVTGVDFSAQQLELARQAVPSANFIESDLIALDLPANSFEAIVAFYVLFHLPRAEQVDLLASIWRWLKPGGYFLGTMSKRNEEPYTEDEFFGVEMYWTNFALDEYEQFLRDLGFELLESAIVGHGYEGDRRNEQHPLVFARKPMPS